MKEWISEHALFLSGVSILLLVGGLGAIVGILIGVPADYFVRQRRWSDFARHRPPVMRVALWILKNGAGAVMLALGIVMMIPLVPGPGLLFFLLGLSLLDVPGKRRLERYILGLPLVLKSANALRARWRRGELILKTDRELH